MSWWRISGPHLTCAVRVENGIVVEGAPIIKRFIGQPSKNLGRWMRSYGDFTFERIDTPEQAATKQKLRDLQDDPPSDEEIVAVIRESRQPTYTYIWGNNPKRATLKGRDCRILLRGARRSVMVEFENGQREIVSYRALRERRT